MRIPLLAAALLASATAARAEHPTIAAGEDWTLIFDGQLRPRLNADTGLDFNARGVGGNNTLVTQRARLGATARHKEGFALTLRLQDVRTWGEETDTLNDFSANGFDVHEAFGVIPLFDRFSLKLGRQEINLANQRLVGAVDWTQRARSFDGGRLTFKQGPFDAGLIYAKLVEPDGNGDGTIPYPATQLDGEFGGLHATLSPLEGVSATALYLVNAPQTTGRGESQTTGLLLTGERAGFAATAEAYYQFGEVADVDLDAWFAAGRLGYTFPVALKPSLTAWAEWLSGDGTPGTQFNTLYATNHKFYGELDFFIAFPRDTAGLGLLDLGGQLAAAPLPQVRCWVDYHYFQTSTADPAGERVLGQEIDVRVNWTATGNIWVGLLYGVFFPGEAMRFVRQIPAGQELYSENALFLTTDLTF